MDPADEIDRLLTERARLRVLLAKVAALPSRDRYRLYMSMMGHEPLLLDGTDWAHVLHRMVAGSHNLAAYTGRAARIDMEVRERFGLDAAAIEAAYRRIHHRDPGYLDPLLDLTHRMLERYYSFAGRPEG